MVAAITSLISKLNRILAALSCADNAGLYILNSVSDNAHDMFLKSQRMLNNWHEGLKFAVGDLKLTKCYWTLEY